MKLLEDFDNLFLSQLNTCLAKKKSEYNKIHIDAPVMIDILSEFMNRKSKHIRPAMFFFSYKNWEKNEPSEYIWNIALAIEFVHALALIHDDIIDKSVLRRGKPTIHESNGVDSAILLGDLALTIADELYVDSITSLEIDLEQKRLLNATFNALKQETIIGEYMDVMKNDDIFSVMKLKTAQYTFEKPAILGMILAGVSNEQIAAWSQIFLDIGITFQIYDDFIGSFGNELVIGKSTDSDIKEGKYTVFAKLFLERASGPEKERFLSFFGSENVSKDDLTWFQSKSNEYGITTTIRYDIENRVKRIKARVEPMKGVREEFMQLLTIILHKMSDFDFLSDSVDNQPTARL